MAGHGVSAAKVGDHLSVDGHVRFLYAALTLATCGGFALAIWLPAQAALGHLTVSWLAYAQVHGHLQVIGFAGLFVLGVATKLLPRFGGGYLARPGLVEAAFWAVLVGLLARAVAQPFAEAPAFGAITAAGAAAEVLGAGLFLVSAALSLRPSIAEGAPHALLMLAGMCWFAVQSVLGALWLTSMVLDGDAVLRADRDMTLVTIQLFGFLLCVFSGVGLRSFPSFFGMPPASVTLGRATFAVLQAGLVAWVAGHLVTVGGGEGARLAAAGQGVVGAGVLLLISTFGFWRRQTRFAAASQPLAWPLRATLLMLTLTGALFLAAGVGGAIGGGVSAARADALRHTFALGVITQGIVVMSQLILPEFASERLVRPPARWRSLVLAATLVGAVVFRGLLPLAGVGGTARFWSMALGGALGWLAVAAFAVMFLRARRAHVAYLQRVAVWRLQALPSIDVDPGAPPPRRDGPPFRP